MKGLEPGGKGGVLFLSLSPFLCRSSKSTFAPSALGAPQARFCSLYPLFFRFLFFPFPQLYSCRWRLERFCRYRRKSFGDTGSTETPEVQQPAGCALRLRALPPNSSPDTAAGPPPAPQPAPPRAVRGVSLGVLTQFDALLPRCFQRPSPWSENVQWSY